MLKNALLITGVFVALAAGAAAQTPVEFDPGRSVRTRADLEHLLELYEEVLRSPAYSEASKASVRRDAERVRVRLRDGDFRLGDRIVLSVEGEPNVPDTVAVQAGPMISLPLFGDISLSGVLRSEIQSHLTEELRRYIRDPVVRAQGLMRISVMGAVGSPGFYVVPADMLLGEALMVAGGPASDANMNGLQIRRGQNVLMEGDELQEAIREGLTLDQLDMQAGDQITMPTSGSFLTNLGLIAGVAGSLMIIIVQFAN